jgi:preprotein translocase subunit SecA
MDFEKPTLTQRFRRLTGNPVDFDLRPYADLVAQVGEVEPEVAQLDDGEIRDRMQSLRVSVEQDGDANAVLVEAFALVRAAAKRRLGERPFNFVIVDEADSILIDEARVPLVIAGDTDDTIVGLGRLAALAVELRSGVDYDTDEYSRNINLTEEGSHRVEELLGCDNLFSEESLGLLAGVRNAKNDEAEAEIVAEAGMIGAVTISTNMAGRSTDIRLGGRDEGAHDAVVALGGLYVIGTNRHESLRIDRQLRGRAGRQGDPGSSRFFVGLDDDLLVRFGLEGLIPRSGMPERQKRPVDDPLLRREIARAQRIVDGQDIDTRRTLRKYSDVVEAQRRYIQGWRKEILEGIERPRLLAATCGPLCAEVEARVGEAMLRDIERRITLLVIDRCWCDYLAEMARVRDGIHLVTLGGKTPYEVFHTHARKALELTLENIDGQIV